MLEIPALINKIKAGNFIRIKSPTSLTLGPILAPSDPISIYPTKSQTHGPQIPQGKACYETEDGTQSTQKSKEEKQTEQITDI